jgi:guanine deaminase
MDKQQLIYAIEKSRESAAAGGFPAGAIIVKDGQIIGEGISIGAKLHDPTSHAELSAIRSACTKIGNSDLSGATLYASLEPCLMCLGAAMWSGMSRIVFACSSKKVATEYYGGNYATAAIASKFNKPIELEHIAELEDTSLTLVHQWESSLQEQHRKRPN